MRGWRRKDGGGRKGIEEMYHHFVPSCLLHLWGGGERRKKGGREGKLNYSHAILFIPAHMTTMGPMKRQMVARRGRKMAGFVQPYNCAMKG